MKRLFYYLNKNRHLFILLYFVIYRPWFDHIEQTITTEFHWIHTPLDDMIPFCEYFVVPYILWFAYVAWGMIYFALRNAEEFNKLCLFLFTGMTIFLIISTAYPNGHYLRPVYFEHHNIFTRMCGMIYATDTATNLFPSIHVYNSLAIHFAVIRSREFKYNRVVRFLSLVLTISIILATMFIKQHSCFDVVTGILLGFIMYYFTYIVQIFRPRSFALFKQK